MLSDQPLWRFENWETDDAGPPVVELPGAAVIEAVSVLIEHETTVRAIQIVEISKPRLQGKFATIIAEALSPQMVGWWTRSSGGLILQEEPRVMLDDDAIKQRDVALEAQLKSIMSKPELAEEAFPDEQMRKKIVPLFEHFRRIGEAAAERSKSEKS